MAPGARLALRKAGKRGPVGKRGPAGSGSGGGFAETFTQAGPVSVANGATQVFTLDRAVAWTTPAGAIDTVYMTAKVTAPACAGNDLRVGMPVTVDGAQAQPWYENILYVSSSATSSFGDIVTTLGPGGHALTGFAIQSANPGCTLSVTDIVVAVLRQS